MLWELSRRKHEKWIKIIPSGEILDALPKDNQNIFFESDTQIKRNVTTAPKHVLNLKFLEA